MRLVNTFTQGDFQAKVYKDTEWNEYRVKYFHHGEQLSEACDSFEQTQQDANDTACAELKFMKDKA